MVTILVVCTGNICRSPIAEGFLRQVLEDRRIEGVEVESAGVSGLDGSPAVHEAVSALAERGVDISSHLARTLTRRMTESADLVLAMTSDQRDAMARLAPAAADRTFTLKELVYLIDRRERRPTGGDPGQQMVAAASNAAAMRRAGDALDLVDEDIQDPLGLGSDVFRAVAWQLETLVRRLVDGLFGPGDGQELPGDSGSAATARSGRRGVVLGE
jgi:protein-tyrosine phosphatase